MPKELDNYRPERFNESVLQPVQMDTANGQLTLQINPFHP